MMFIACCTRARSPVTRKPNGITAASTGDNGKKRMLAARSEMITYLFDDRPEDASVALVVNAVRERKVYGVVLPLRHA